MDKHRTAPPIRALDAPQASREIIPPQPAPNPPARCRNLKKAIRAPGNILADFPSFKKISWLYLRVKSKIFTRMISAARRSIF
jgi:hypothetical protein